MADDYKVKENKNTEDAELRQSMAERNEAAKRAAEERIAKLEYEDAYRNKLAEERERRNAEKKKLKEAEEKAKNELLAIKREREIAEFLQKEREEAEARAAQSAALLRALERPEQEPSAVPVFTAPKADEPAPVSAPAEIDGKIHINADGTDDDNIVIEAKSFGAAPQNAYYTPVIGHMPPPMMNPYAYGAPGMPQANIPVGGAQQGGVQSSAPNVKSDEGTAAPASVEGSAPRYPENPTLKLSKNYGEDPNIDSDDTAKRGLEADREAARGDYEEAHRLYKEEELAYIEEQKRKYEENARILRERREQLAARRAELDAEGDPEPDIEYVEEPGDQQYHTPDDEKKIADYAKYLAAREQKRNARNAKRASKGAKDTPDPEPRDYGKNTRYNISISDTGKDQGDEYDVNELENLEPEYDDVDITVEVGNKNAPAVEPEPKMTRSELYKILAKCHKSEDELVANRKKIEKKQKKADTAENAKLMAEKLAVSKSIIRVAEDEIFACLSADDKKELEKHKKFLASHIAEYNREISEFEKLSGASLLKIDKKAHEDIVRRRRRIEIPDIRYTGTRAENYSPDISYDQEIYDGDNTESAYIDVDYPENEKRRPDKRDKRDERAEQMRLLREEKEEKERRRREELAKGDSKKDPSSVIDKKAEIKERASRLAEVNRAKERDELLINSRARHKITKLEAERDALETKLTLNTRSPKKQINEISKKIKVVKADQKAALKLEKADNELYYKIIVDRPAEFGGDRLDRDYLETAKMKLELLLSHREELNERLIELYDMAEKGRNSADALNSVKRRHASSMYKRQKKMMKKISVLRMPSDLKAKIIDLMNQKTDLVANVEAMKYKLKKSKAKGAAKRQLKAEIKRSNASIKRIDADIEFMMKKADKHHAEYKMNREWLRWVIGVILVAGIGFAVWYFAGDAIVEWFNSLISKGGAK